ncbi:D-glycero-alpha-D-manno-heptose-1,7-bisphosphate 7-phosphatase [Roseateles cellulosilyticus]|uniref:D,D-heptose 1,7-bisphosphate phosphatase n=1 Tax=Pelomonas cellulosilytica TaxID=2906762 RepID=A0ABS8XPN0_9BURK|nr:HAD-IIIA family hydrolase [Pelomonas sp. P8]MCE4553098.1 HAD-IIIA family hydrolase [Pelomonas sp. P8]
MNPWRPPPPASTACAAGPLRWRRTPVRDEPDEPARREQPQRPAVFLDKDGTLIDGMPCNADPALLKLRPGAADALAALASAGYALLVATNQAGLARGYYTRTQFAQLQAGLERQLHEATGVTLLDFLVCPHAPAPDGRPSCLCRKPAPGLLVRAARRHGIDLARSWMVGDSLADVEAGHRAGCRTVLLSDDESGAPTTPLRRPDARAQNWADVTAHILSPTPAS